ncbi:MAG: monovalent cation/H+ antiporter complex subunit F [Actinomycetota bacterium]|jgi:multicomponent Na+:H+ antiporter subunit F
MRHQAVFLAGITWLAVLLGVAVLWIWRARTTAERLVALDAAVLVLVGLLGLVAGEEQRSYPLDAAGALALLSFVSTLAAARYLGDRRPFEQPDRPAEGPPP